jgi:glycosyltransferase involved in cell wall biosynthesis
MPALFAPPPERPVEPGPPPSFSVIIAAYQAAEFVGDAVASALAQTSPAAEVIVCDDGSTDDLARALAPYADRITLIHREHQGEGATKHAAAEAASGEFVSLLDADDAYVPGRLEAIGRAAAARPDIDMFTTDAYLEAGGEVVRRWYERPEDFPVTNQRRALLQANFVFGATAIRRTRLLEVGGFDGSIVSGADWECWLRLVFSGSLVGLVPEPLYRYRLHANAMSSDRELTTRGLVQTLETASRRLELTAEERAELEDAIVRQRLSSEAEQARRALIESAPDARRRSLAVARQPGNSLPRRLKAAVGAAAPRATRRWLVRREARGWVGAGEVHIPRSDDSA